MNRMAFHRAIGQAAVDHNDLVPHVAQRPDATDAAPVKLHAAADAVRPAAQHDDAGLLGYAMVVSCIVRPPRYNLSYNQDNMSYILGNISYNLG